jgi:hypothetical protein
MTLLEGLPHQAWEREVFERELLRDDVARVAGWPFYRDPLPLGDETATALEQLVGDPSCFTRWGGAKRCGGFHPD